MNAESNDFLNGQDEKDGLNALATSLVAAFGNDALRMLDAVDSGNEQAAKMRLALNGVIEQKKIEKIEFDKQIEKYFNSIELPHGIAVRLLWKFIQDPNDTHVPDWFVSYIRYLRREGVPFQENELGMGRGRNVAYNMYHIMEISIALLLRWHGISNKDIPRFIIKIRKKLRVAFIYSASFDKYGNDSASYSLTDDYDKATISGIYLDLGLHYIDKELMHAEKDNGDLIVMNSRELIRHIAASKDKKNQLFLCIFNLSGIFFKLNSIIANSPRYLALPL